MRDDDDPLGGAEITAPVMEVILMEREILKVTAESKAEAITALEMMLDIVKREYGPSDPVEWSCFANMHIK